VKPAAAFRDLRSPIDKVLERLDGVRQSGPGRWLARCPAHDDGRPSLSIREGDDGRVLLHCFTGCGGLEIVDALGLQWADLFVESDRRPTQPGDRHPRRARRAAPPIPASDALELLDQEALTVQIAAAELAAGRQLTEVTDDLERAALRIAAIRAAWAVAP
jgi:hypothetical protein